MTMETVEQTRGFSVSRLMTRCPFSMRAVLRNCKSCTLVSVQSCVEAPCTQVWLNSPVEQDDIRKVHKLQKLCQTCNQGAAHPPWLILSLYTAHYKTGGWELESVGVSWWKSSPKYMLKCVMLINSYPIFVYKSSTDNLIKYNSFYV